ncbi:hypothetical protein [Mycolicibacterium iranicum]|uniref:IrrE N-terminal-like domain-containing protein n=1 Tax=Mycolicibacterium iranicum TaxID=912594 RepID=A0ABT4HQY7_MYCIR|nr:hypothetical protein [Mycolicibacterium iranicum]MCZ0732221.1 hypothetical protein [Mycolicibacterium iranicum]
MTTAETPAAPVNPDAPTSGGDRCEPTSYMKEGSTRTLLAPRPRWNPWAELDRHPQLRVKFTDIPDPHRFGELDFANREIRLDRKLNHSEMRCTVGHELVHWERGPLPPGSKHWADEEEIVDEIASCRLITFEDLLDVIREYPSGSLKAWSVRLWVDVPTLKSRLKCLRPHELEAIEDIRTEAQALTRAVGRLLKERQKKLAAEENDK